MTTGPSLGIFCADLKIPTRLRSTQRGSCHPILGNDAVCRQDGGNTSLATEGDGGACLATCPD
jgi:hypothetical protein